MAVVQDMASWIVATGRPSSTASAMPQNYGEKLAHTTAAGDIEAGAAEQQAVLPNGNDARADDGNGLPPPPSPPSRRNVEPAPMRNLYAAALSYNGYTVTDGALRLIVLFNAARLGFTAIEIAFMFSMYEVAGVFTNLFGGLAGSKYGLKCTLLTSLVLQIACLVGLTQTETATGNLDDATGVTRLEATIYITAWQALAGVAKDLMKLTGKSTPKLVTKQGAEGKLFQLVAWLTGMKNALKGFGHFLGAVLVQYIGYEWSLLVLVVICVVFIPIGIWGMDRGLGVSETKKIDWKGLYKKGRRVNLLSGARFFLFGSRDVWFEIGLPLFLKFGLDWDESLVGLFLAGYIVVYGNLQAASTKLYKKTDGTAGHPTAKSAFTWAAWCSVVPLVTGILAYCTFIVADSKVWTAVVLIIGLATFAALFAVNSSVHSYLIVSYSDKDKVSIDLGFYYMANAAGRLVGTLLGGFLYHFTYKDFGLSMCLVVACPFLIFAAILANILTPDDEAGNSGDKDLEKGVSSSVKGSENEPARGAENDLERRFPSDSDYEFEFEMPTRWPRPFSTDLANENRELGRPSLFKSASVRSAGRAQALYRNTKSDKGSEGVHVSRRRTNHIDGECKGDGKEDELCSASSSEGSGISVA